MVHISHETLKRYKMGALWPERHSNANPLCESLPKVSSKALGSPLLSQPQPISDIIVQQLSHRTLDTPARSEAFDLVSTYWDQNR